MPLSTFHYNWKGKIFLLIEDDETTCFLINEYLSSTNAELVFAKNHKEALSIFNNKKIDLCLLDIHLRNENGLDVATIIREKDPSVLFLVQTALSENEAIKNCSKYGFSDYINKPYSFGNFLSAIDKCLKKSETVHRLELCN
jgi:DNA-binding response OmpR family regulator